MQVWCNNKLVGEANLTPHPDQSCHTIMKMPAEDLALFTTATPAYKVEQIILPIRKRSIMVDDIEFVQSVGDVEQIVRAHHGIPPEATIHLDYQRMRRVFTWKVFDLDPDTFEEIFDMSWFEPTDAGEPDVERLKRSREWAL